MFPNLSYNTCKHAPSIIEKSVVNLKNTSFKSSPTLFSFSKYSIDSDVGAVKTNPSPNVRFCFN